MGNFARALYHSKMNILRITTTIPGPRIYENEVDQEGERIHVTHAGWTKEDSTCSAETSQQTCDCLSHFTRRR